MGLFQLASFFFTALACAGFFLGGGGGICFSFFVEGVEFSSVAIFDNLVTPHNLNAWERLSTNITFVTLHTLLCFAINIKQKYQWFISSFIRCL